MKTRIPFLFGGWRMEDGGGTGEGDDASKQYAKQQAVNRGMDIGQVKVKNYDKETGGPQGEGETT